MFNPLVTDLTEISDDQLTHKTQDLTSKYFKTQNPHVQQQIITMIEMIKQEQNDRVVRKKMQDNGDDDLDNLINID